MKRSACLFLLCFTVACGSKSSPNPVTPTPVTPTPSTTLQSVGLSAALANLTQAGNTAQVTATGTFSNGSTQNVTATCTDWFSDNAFVSH